MYGLKFFTSGKAFEDEHSDIIGYEVHRISGIVKVWLQPKEATKFQAETMEDFNKITIAELKEVGLPRDKGMTYLLQNLLSGETCVCWFEEFIDKGVKKLMSERKQQNNFRFSCLDLFPLAKEALPDRGSYRLVDIMEELEVDNLVELFERLCALATYKGVRRL